MAKISTPVFKIIENKKVKIEYSDLGIHKRVHINLKRYKKGKCSTITLYDSILLKDSKYATIWIDKQGKQLIGLEVTWK